LMYHEIVPDTRRARKLAVSRTALAGQLAGLASAGYATVTVSEIVAALRGGRPLPPRPVALTFDDGYADFHSEAMPLLQRYGFTATAFITTGWIEDSRPPSAARHPGPMLSW